MRVGSAHPSVGDAVGATWLPEHAERAITTTAARSSRRRTSPYAEAVRDKRGNGERDWGNIDWSNLDLSTLGRRRGTARRPPSRRGVVITLVVFFLLLV